MTATATALKPAAAQLTLDFSHPARPSNVIQLADHRKPPVESDCTRELRETCQLFIKDGAAATQLFEYLTGAMMAVTEARREGGEQGPALRAYAARWKSERA